jgi:hypothetical protein
MSVSHQVELVNLEDLVCKDHVYRKFMLVLNFDEIYAV